MKHTEVVKLLREIYKKIKIPKGYKKKICTHPYSAGITIYQAEGEVLPILDDAGELQESLSHKISAVLEIVRNSVVVTDYLSEDNTETKFKVSDLELSNKINNLLAKNVAI